MIDNISLSSLYMKPFILLIIISLIFKLSLQITMHPLARASNTTLGFPSYLEFNIKYLYFGYRHNKHFSILNSNRHTFKNEEDFYPKII